MEFLKTFWVLYLLLLALVAAGVIHYGIETLRAWFAQRRQRKQMTQMPKRIRRLNTFA